MRAVVPAVLVALGLPTVASAATVTVSAPGSSGRTLTVNLGGATRVTVARNGNDVFVSARSTDTINASGCSASAGGVICGAESTFNRIVVNGSSGNDEIAISSSITRATTLDGNNGNDELAGGAGADTIVGDNGNDVISGGDGSDDLTGSAGADAISGDAGNDTIDGSAGADLLAGGGQSGDVVEYQGRSAPVRIDLTGATASGEAGEGDVLEGFGVALGGSGGDTIVGGAAGERLEGHGGADVLSGAGGNDILNGGAGADALDGGDGVDRLSGGAGDDALVARDGGADAALSCGGDRDRLASDPSDPPTTDCEVLAPAVSGEIAVTGEPAVGGTLQASFDGGVSGTESSRAWRWERCRADGCAGVGDAASYAVTAADVGAQLRAVLRAENEAGAGELASALVGPVPAVQLSVDPPPVLAPPPAAVTPAVTVRSVKCSGRRCRVAVTLTTSVTRVRAQLTKGKRSVAAVTRKSAGGNVTLTVTARRRLARGTYKLKVAATGAKAVTKTVRIKR